MAKMTTLEHLKKATAREKTNTASRIAELAEMVAEGLESVQHVGITITLPAADWSGEKQTVLNEAFLADSGYWYLVHNCGGAQAEDITVNGQLNFKCEDTPAEDMTVSIIRLGMSSGANGTNIGKVFNLQADMSGSSTPAGVASFNGRKGAVIPQTGDYTASMVGALPATTTIPNKTSQLTNDSGFITSFTETDPTVPEWAKAANKPTYTASEVGAVPTSRKVNGKALSADITLAAADVGARPSTWTPTAADVGALATDGTAASATKLATARTIRVNLASTGTASFNGTANITPGITGTLAIAHGGTGATTAAQAKANLGVVGGFVAQASAPTDTTLGWVDTTNGNVLKFYNSGWKTVNAVWG